MARKRRRTKRRRRRGGTHTWEQQQKKDHKDLEDEVKKARSGSFKPCINNVLKTKIVS